MKQSDKPMNGIIFSFFFSCFSKSEKKKKLFHSLRQEGELSNRTTFP